MPKAVKRRSAKILRKQKIWSKMTIRRNVTSHELLRAIAAPASCNDDETRRKTTHAAPHIG